MNIEAIKLFEEIKEYLITGEYEYELKANAPEDIKEKFKQFKRLATCEEIIEDDSTQEQ